MGRRATSPYITPIKSDGTLPAPGGDAAIDALPGIFTLAAATYYVPLPGGEDSWLVSLMAQWDATAVITSITIEETDLPEATASWFAASAGKWFPVDSSKIKAAFNGAGTTAVTAGAIGHTVAGAGGSIQNAQDVAARRFRAAVVVATGGEARFSGWAKE